MEYNAFNDFLFGYIVAGHTIDDSVSEELNNLTNEFVNNIYSEYIFTEQGTSAYIEFVKGRLSDENKHWFPLRFNEQRYLIHLEKWIMYIINNKNIND